MTERDRIVSDDELHAYVDGELPADRRGAVEAWLATHADDAARVATWRAQADLIRARYGGIADEKTPPRLDVNRILRRRWNVTAAAMAATIAAFLIGGVSGWTARGLKTASAPDLIRFTSDALDAYKLYTVEVRHPVEVSGDQQPHLIEWLSKRVGSPLRAPDLDKVGLKLVGGRLLPGPTGPTAFFMYEGPSGERFTLYCGRTGDQETALRYTTGQQNAAYYWVDRNLAYVLSGPAEQNKLHEIAQTAYDQIDRHSPQGS
ncbi:MAG TPA: anti-sigma factor [Xanthobacteraceae bacterium]|jgi:anti-sigma factor RsiW|nr:anti-sigma factor [Xanthobacteraceae bacterium]